VKPAQGIIPGQPRLARPPLRAPALAKDSNTEELRERRVVTVDIDLRLRDLKAAVPIYTTDLSVTNNAFIRPIVAFIKWVQKLFVKVMLTGSANRTLVPIHCQVDADLVSV
jgi:distribution and morphology protein 31